MNNIATNLAATTWKFTVPRARILLIFSVLLYVAALILGHERYLAVEHAFWGFNQPHYDLLTLFVTVVLAIVPASVMPLYFDRPSTLFINALAFFVYIPGLVIAMLNRVDALDAYFWLFFNFCLGLLICSLLVRSTGRSLVEEKVPSRFMIGFNLCGALFCFIVLFLTYRDILTFSGLNEIYLQREKGAATSLFIGYCQVYLAYFFSPVLFVSGVLYKRLFLALLGFSGFIFIYMITAERTVILLPFILLVVAMAFKIGGFGARNGYGLFLLGAVFVALVSMLFEQSQLVSQFGVYFFMRLIAIPGLFVSQYYDLFSVQGYTHWSHVSVIGNLFEVPRAYAGDEKWPALGKILAERVLGIQSQSNAGFVATDGVAAFGSIGVLIICLLYSGWLLLLDHVSRGWSPLFLMTVLFPLAFITTNGSFFTILASFGGALWIVLLWVDKYRFRLIREAGK
ncbi:hypothetical protein [Pseudomonas sp. G(2018)]|uniref:hypothetical protein n=1 Tax=Pseudomonas sp. G(2018) TaxID=2502242 RepID=UPI0021143892|nr:hypothetical protein [Pseudomonas sp. G(2018)]